MNFRSSKSALLLGAINGLIYGIVYQPVSAIYFAFDYRRTLAVFNGMPPQMVRIQPLAEYIVWFILFTLASYTVHRFWKTKIKSDVVLWQVVAIFAFVVPSVLIYLVEQVSYFIGALQMKIERGEWGYFPGILPDDNDLEFGALFMGLAICINFFYGAVIGKIANRFGK
jgi:hypothetical protein